jgi:peptidylprolyl isomerase/peptidyl-prolyl cis-trans isomerase B (cyclophilin B)
MLKKLSFLIAALSFALFTASAEEKETNQPKDTADMKDKPVIVEEEIVTLITPEGVMVIKLDAVAAPKHAENFKKLVKEGFYDGTTFHRIIPQFMIQGGDPLSKDQAKRSEHGTGGPGYTIPAEIGKKHKRGSLAAARQGDQVNPKRNSSGSQFYIVIDEMQCRQLDGQYTVFGEVIEGMDVADKIVAKPRDARDNPKEPVTMKAKLGRPKS